MGAVGVVRWLKAVRGVKQAKVALKVCGRERAWGKCGYRRRGGTRPWARRLSQGLRGAAGLPATPARIGLSVRGRGQSPVARETAPPVPAARARTTAQGSRRGGRGGRSAAGRLLGRGPAHPGDFGASRCPRPGAGPARPRRGKRGARRPRSPPRAAAECGQPGAGRFEPRTADKGSRKPSVARAPGPGLAGARSSDAAGRGMFVRYLAV